MVTNLFIRITKSPLMRSVLSAAAGFIIYGLWAYWINSSEDKARALTSALIQGSYSFTITLVLNFFMEWFYRYLINSQRLASFFLASSRDKVWVIPTVVAVATCLLLYITSWSIHFIANTPEIFFTILPGAMISSVYTVIYVLSIHRSYSRA